MSVFSFAKASSPTGEQTHKAGIVIPILKMGKCGLEGLSHLPETAVLAGDRVEMKFSTQTH